MGSTKDTDQPNAYSIGAACFVTSYLLSLQFTDIRKVQILEGLKATSALNEDNMFDLANLPPPEKMN